MMAHKEEVEPNIYLIPKNSFDTGYVLGGQFRTRNFVEGIILALPFLGVFAYGWVKLGWDFRSTIAYCIIICAAVFLFTANGIKGDSLFEFLNRVRKFRQNRRISKYNPRIKTELEPDYLLDDGKTLPKEKLKQTWEAFKDKVVGGGDGPVSSDITADDLRVYYDDDEDFVAKPDELKTKAELKAEAKQRAKEEKEYIRSLPRNQRRAAKAALKQKHKEEAAAKKKQKEEQERFIQESINRRIEKAERVKTAQYRAKLKEQKEQEEQEEQEDTTEKTVNVVSNSNTEPNSNTEIDTTAEQSAHVEDVEEIDGSQKQETSEDDILEVEFDEDASEEELEVELEDDSTELLPEDADEETRKQKLKEAFEKTRKQRTYEVDVSSLDVSIFDDEE